MPRTTGVRSTLVSSVEELHDRPGAICFIDRCGDTEAYFVHSCPCGCGMFSGINLKPDPDRPDAPVWIVTGPREAMTLAPSVGIHAIEFHADLGEPFRTRATKEADGFHWHGFLRNGVWESV